MPSGHVLVQVVGAAIVDDLRCPTRLLAARRTEPEALAGFWELPGGKVEPGESHAQALHREIEEELGVAIELGAMLTGPLEHGRWQLSPRHVMTVWLAQVVSGTPTALEDHDDVRWVDAETMTDLPWLAGDLAILDALADHLT